MQISGCLAIKLIKNKFCARVISKINCVIYEKFAQIIFEVQILFYYKKCIRIKRNVHPLTIKNVAKGDNTIMIEQDTIRLLRECDAGIKMGVTSIDDVLSYVSNDNLRQDLIRCKNSHIIFEEEIQCLVAIYHDYGKEPDLMAKGMSWLKTNVKLVLNESDHTIASLMTDGCNMGIKSLHQYLNEYQAADETSKDIAKRLIHLEESLVKDVREYL